MKFNKRIESSRIRIETVTVTSLNSGCISIKEENPIKQGLKLSDNILLCFCAIYKDCHTFKRTEKLYKKVFEEPKEENYTD